MRKLTSYEGDPLIDQKGNQIVGNIRYRMTRLRCVYGFALETIVAEQLSPETQAGEAPSPPPQPTDQYLGLQLVRAIQRRAFAATLRARSARGGSWHSSSTKGSNGCQHDPSKSD